MATDGTGYIVDTGSASRTAENVDIAAGPYQRPNVPSFADVLAPEGFHLHSSDYHIPAQLPDGPVLVVGALASGCQIADDLFESGRSVTLSVGSQPLLSPPPRFLGRDVYWWGSRTRYINLTIDSRLGRGWPANPRLLPAPAPGGPAAKVPCWWRGP